jgi:hypothetical protein
MQASYVGPLIVSMDCDLKDRQGNSLSQPLKPLIFQVRDHIDVRSTAYKIGGHTLDDL